MIAYPPDKTTALGTWVVKQRMKYKKGELSPEQIAALESLPDWLWDRRIPVGTICQVPCGCSNRATRRIENLLVCEGHRQQHDLGKDYTFLIRKGFLTGACQVPCGCERRVKQVQNGIWVCDSHAAQHPDRVEDYIVLRERMPKGQKCQATCGCPRLAAARSGDKRWVCVAHKEQWRRNQSYTPIQERIPPEDKGKCQVPCGCTRDAVLKQDGLMVCRAHWHQKHVYHKQYTPLQDASPVTGFCQVPCGCDRTAANRAVVHGKQFAVCTAHYAQQRQRKDDPTYEFYPLPGKGWNKRR